MGLQTTHYEGSGITETSPNDLQRTERLLTALNSLTLPSQGSDIGYGFERLKSIHLHLFGSYRWAGQLRTNNIEKGASRSDHLLASDIVPTLSELERRLQRVDFFRNSSEEQFTSGISRLYSDLDRAYPFAAGNGRAIRRYLEDVASLSGRHLDWTAVPPHEFNGALKKTAVDDLDSLKSVFSRISVPGMPTLHEEYSMSDLNRKLGAAFDQRADQLKAQITKSKKL